MLLFRMLDEICVDFDVVFLNVLKELIVDLFWVIGVIFNDFVDFYELVGWFSGVDVLCLLFSLFLVDSFSVVVGLFLCGIWMVMYYEDIDCVYMDNVYFFNKGIVEF